MAKSSFNIPQHVVLETARIWGVEALYGHGNGKQIRTCRLLLPPGTKELSRYEYGDQLILSAGTPGGGIIRYVIASDGSYTQEQTLPDNLFYKAPSPTRFQKPSEKQFSVEVEKYARGLLRLAKCRIRERKRERELKILMAEFRAACDRKMELLSNQLELF